MRKIFGILICIFLIFLFNPSSFSYASPLGISEGYTLYAPLESTRTYLINNDGGEKPFTNCYGAFLWPYIYI